MPYTDPRLTARENRGRADIQSRPKTEPLPWPTTGNPDRTRHDSGLSDPLPADLEDRFGRRFAYLRLSITDVCNFRCEYCLPDGYQGRPTGFLNQAEIGHLTRAFAELGIRKVRITGGEPLVRKDAIEIIADIAATPGIDQVALTTNAFNLEKTAPALRAAGLTAINVSLDSLDPAGFERITGDRRHARVMAGVDAAIDAGIPKVKLNTVLLAGLNDHEVPDFMEYVRHRPVSVRFIELMQTADNGDYFRKRHVSGRRIAEQLRKAGWRPVERGETDGPAVEFSHPDYQGRIGLITPYAPGFCDGCNRLRVTARGGLRLCLFGNGTHDLRPLLQGDGDRDSLKQSIYRALFQKQAGHHLHDGDFGDTPHLASTGG